MEREDDGNSFGKPVYSVQTCLSFWTQKQDLHNFTDFNLQPYAKVLCKLFSFPPVPLEYRSIWGSFQSLQSSQLCWSWELPLLTSLVMIFSSFLFFHLKVIKAVPLTSKWEDLKISEFPEAVVKIWKNYLFLEIWQSSCLSQPSGFMRNL